MTVQDIVSYLEIIAPPSLQEDYDNAGLLTGQGGTLCTGALICLDCSEHVVKEAATNNCNLIICHHPIIFSGLKKLTGKNYAERVIIAAIKNDIAIYAIHTNLDNVIEGVNGKIGDLLGLVNRKIILQKEFQLKKLITFAPVEMADKVREAIFKAGGGHIGKYSECSFTSEGIGTYTPGEGADPTIGEKDKRETGKELKMEFIFFPHLQSQIVEAMTKAHGYEEVAYDIIPLGNHMSDRGSGLIGELPAAMPEADFIKHIQHIFKTPAVKYTALCGKPIKKVAVCGGAGSFLINKVKETDADIFITSDVKYHEFFEADNKFILADVGHYESEQYTIDLLFDLLREKFPNFALLKTGVNTNPVHYFVP